MRKLLTLAIALGCSALLGGAYHALSGLLDLSGCRRIVMDSQATNWFSTPQQLKMAYAIDGENTSEIKRLIEVGTVKANDYGLVHHNNERPISFLEFAVMTKAPASVAALLQAGADVNLHTPDGDFSVSRHAMSDVLLNKSRPNAKSSNSQLSRRAFGTFCITFLSAPFSDKHDNRGPNCRHAFFWCEGEQRA